MTLHVFYGPKGGAGCSAAALAAALAHARRLPEGAPPVLLLDCSPARDVAALAGLPAGTGDRLPAELGPRLFLRTAPTDPAPVIPDARAGGWSAVYVDAGTDRATAGAIVANGEPDDRRHLCIRGDYLSVRAAVSDPWPADDVIVLARQNQPLRREDVAAVLGAPLAAWIVADNTTARTIDAGLFACRPAPTWADQLDAEGGAGVTSSTVTLRRLDGFHFRYLHAVRDALGIDPDRWEERRTQVTMTTDDARDALAWIERTPAADRAEANVRGTVRRRLVDALGA